MNFDINELAKSMMSNGGSRDSSIDVGYTYLGQFIAHELIPSTRQLDSRMVSGILALDSLYQETSIKKLQRGSSIFNNDGTFKVSEDEKVDSSTPKRKGDLYRLADGSALIPEQRNDQNRIIAQLHRLFQNLHNTLITRKYVKGKRRAKEITTLLIQFIIVEDYLEKILNPTVYKCCIKQNKNYLNPNCLLLHKIFSHASFRFGHSMVKVRYVLNENAGSIELTKLFSAGDRIPLKDLIDWNKAMFGQSTGDHKALKIDTKIAGSMNPLSNKPMCFNGHIATLNLEASTALPTAVEYINQVKHKIKDLNIQPLKDISGASFADVPNLTINELPFWPYVLLESEKQKKEDRLGKLGSITVAEVIRNAIIKAKSSIYQNSKYDITSAKKKLGRALNKVDFVKQGNFTMMEIIKFIHN